MEEKRREGFTESKRTRRVEIYRIGGGHGLGCSWTRTFADFFCDITHLKQTKDNMSTLSPCKSTSILSP